MDQSSERAQTFERLARESIRLGGQMLLAERNARRELELRTAPSAKPALGEDLPAEYLVQIEQLFGGKLPDIPPYYEAQLRELAFWRWVAFEGYDGSDPRFFPLHQEHFMLATFFKTGWRLGDFKKAKVFELGCGPLGMIEYVEASTRAAYDPLNWAYSKLFADARTEAIDYRSKKEDLDELHGGYDLCICHNMIDHTDNPDWWFNKFFSLLRENGKFLFQVNLSCRDVPQSAEHRAMHPSPITFEQIVDWLDAKSDEYEHSLSNEASSDGEFYFLAWGRKTKDIEVSYAPPILRSDGA